MSLSVLSNINCGSLVARLQAALPDQSIYTPAGYNTWVQELSDPNSPLNALHQGMLFVVLHGEELLGSRGVDSYDEGQRILTPYLDLLEQYALANPRIRLFVSTLDIAQKSVHPLLYPRAEKRLALFWREELIQRKIASLDLEELCSEIGRERFYSPRMWLLGSLPFSQAAELALVTEIVRLNRAARGIRQKCLVLDLDNTLWGGVIGENGLSGISLSSHQRGSEYREFQQRIFEIKQQGVLLAVVSKNNPEDALIAFKEHPDMLLKQEDFAAFYANWDPKPLNLQRIASELNIGTDALVFIDDNPIEREAVKIALPEVVVPDFPKESSQLPSFILAVAKDYFMTLQLTDEDRAKTEQYRTEKKREAHKAQFSSMDDYLRSLDMVLTFSPLQREQTPRAAQLTQKTNQFNLTTRRYTEEQIEHLRLSPNWKIWLGSLRDSFGSHGHVVLALVEIKEKQACIDTFLMSCRVMGRGVEKTFLQLIEAELATYGVESIQAEYCPTAKNSVTAPFYEGCGFKPISQSAERTLFTKTASAAEYPPLLMRVERNGE